MIQWLKSLFQRPNSTINLPGLNVVISHDVHVVWMVDELGGSDEFAIAELSAWLLKRGYLLHGVSFTNKEASDGSNPAQ